MKSGAARLELAPLSWGTLRPALSLARKSFGPEFPLVVGTYAWHFYRRARLPDPGLMAKRSTAIVTPRGGIGQPISYVTTVIHGEDICWVEAEQRSPEWDEALALFARHWRVCVVKTTTPLSPTPMLTPRGTAPGTATAAAHVYTTNVEAGLPERENLRIVQRRRLATTAQFYTLTRNSVVVGITGLYEAEYWPGVAWGAWGTLARHVARRDAAFDALRLTEGLARQRGANWFCIETSSDPRYASARAIYRYYGLDVLFEIPGFFQSSRGETADYVVYGTRL